MHPFRKLVNEDTIGRAVLTKPMLSISPRLVVDTKTYCTTWLTIISDHCDHPSYVGPYHCGKPCILAAWVYCRGIPLWDKDPLPLVPPARPVPPVPSFTSCTFFFFFRALFLFLLFWLTFFLFLMPTSFCNRSIMMSIDCLCRFRHGDDDTMCNW